MTRAIADKLGISRDEAEKLKIRLAQDPTGDAELGSKIQAAIDAALDSLAGAINGHWPARRFILVAGARSSETSRPSWRGVWEMACNASCWISPQAKDGPPPFSAFGPRPRTARNLRW